MSSTLSGRLASRNLPPAWASLVLALSLAIASAVAVASPALGSGPPVSVTAGHTVTAWQAPLDRAGLSVTATTLAPTTLNSELPPDGPVRSAWPVIFVLAVMGWAALGVIAILAALVYALVAVVRR